VVEILRAVDVDFIAGVLKIFYFIAVRDGKIRHTRLWFHVFHQMQAAQFRA
jgi:hypothetical protein